ncbi:MAG: 16S rRNA (guanine(966)-N(2))-methyltransferase RsmD [Steroidobacteraceae bacterium]
MSPSHYDRGRQQRQLRIIAVRWRGRRFRFPEGTIRPTPDRVRETLFNWLQDHIEGAHCLDLYAGSGALGLEALSRGAASVVFVEQQRAAAMTLERLLMEWHALDAQVVCDEARHFLGKRAAQIRPRGFDLVFLDPPYSSGELALAAQALGRTGLAPGARIYIECGPVPEVLPALPASWRELRTGKAGEVRYHLFAAEQ